MKKEYTAPSMRVKKMVARKILCSSNVDIHDKTTTTQYAREFDGFEEEDW